MLVGFPPFLSHADDDDPNTLMNAPFWTLFNERTDMLVDAVKEVHRALKAIWYTLLIDPGSCELVTDVLGAAGVGQRICLRPFEGEPG